MKYFNTRMDAFSEQIVTGNNMRYLVAITLALPLHVSMFVCSKFEDWFSSDTSSIPTYLGIIVTFPFAISGVFGYLTSYFFLYWASWANIKLAEERDNRIYYTELENPDGNAVLKLDRENSYGEIVTVYGLVPYKQFKSAKEKTVALLREEPSVIESNFSV